MSSFVGLTGRDFGRLAIINRTVNIGKNAAWICQCECGRTTTVRASCLLTGHTKSCGCISSEQTVIRNTNCEQWDDFAVFVSDMGEIPEGMTLERIDVNGNHEPSNCTWATMQEQQNNRRSNRYITLNNVTKTMQQWADDIGVSGSGIARRLRENWSIEKALTTPKMEVSQCL